MCNAKFLAQLTHRFTLEEIENMYPNSDDSDTNDLIPDDDASDIEVENFPIEIDEAMSSDDEDCTEETQGDEGDHYIASDQTEWFKHPMRARQTQSHNILREKGDFY